jgi:hypothetical protein
MGILKTHFGQILWFGALYLSSVAVLLLTCASLRAVLHLITAIPT